MGVWVNLLTACGELLGGDYSYEGGERGKCDLGEVEDLMKLCREKIGSLEGLTKGA